VPTGIMGVGGNKGAIAVSLHMAETSIVVVNSHLAASQSKVAKRNANVNTIIKNLLFEEAGLNLMEHKYIFWCGDLNYRIDSDSFETVAEMIGKNQIIELRKLD